MRLKTFIKQGRYISLGASVVLAVLILAIHHANAAPANNADFQELDAVITAQMQKHDLPGLSVAVIDGNQIVYLQGYGTAGRGQPQPPKLVCSLARQANLSPPWRLPNSWRPENWI
jgi:CubicO group peptidase (beta-lactamase class C family)